MGPLQDVRVIELAAVGPVPFCSMLLADMGADVITVDRLDASGPGLPDPMRKMAGRGRRSIAVDLKAATGPEVVLRLTEASDVLVEGFRPGVAERIGVGPDECLGRNPRLVYGADDGVGSGGAYGADGGA